MNKIVVDLYADGGVIDKNPSPIVGTWAWVLADSRDKLRAQGSGIIIPSEISLDAVTVTNNQTELLSILQGLGMVNYKGWKLRYIYSDSQVTLGRVFKGHALNNIPPWMVELKRDLLPVLKGAKGIWVRGHNGNKWNEYVDAAARTAGERLIQDLGRAQENLRKIK